MKTNFTKLFFVTLQLLSSVMANAHDFSVGGIYYNITDSSSKTVKVTYRGNYGSSYDNEYTGRVVIPASVTYNNVTYSVTSIGNSAFNNCSGLTSVTIGNSVTSIGNSAFNNCSGLTSIAIPKSVTSIGSCAFEHCSGLTSIEIPNSVTSIGSQAFYGCSGLTAVHVTDLAAWCNIDFGDSYANPLYKAKNLYLNGEKVAGEVIIPDGTSKIGIYAFYGCSGITNIIVPSSVTSIGRYAFYNCSGLTSIEIPNSVTSIGAWTFEDCSGLTSIEIPNSVTSIGNGTFYGCSGLTSIAIPKSVTSIGSCAFEHCSGLTSIEIPNSVTTIGESTFYKCSGLTSIAIPKSVTSIGDYAFYGCSGLKTVINYSSLNFTKGSTDYGYVALYADKVINAPNGCIIDNFVFSKPGDQYVLVQYSGNAAEIVLPESCNDESYAIGENVFYCNTAITSVTIPNSVTSIGNSAFYGCSGLTAVHITDLKAWCNIDFSGSSANPLYSAKNLYLNGEKVAGEVIIPDGTSKIGIYAFYGYSGITNIIVPSSVTTIGSYAFYNCSGLKTVINYSSLNFTKGSTDYGYVALYADKVINAHNGCIIGDYAFSKVDDQYVLTQYSGNAAEIVLPENCNGENYAIGENAFNGNTTITSIEIPNSVTSIGDYAFEDCSGLTSIEIPNSVTTIGESTFYKCSGLTSITIPNNVTSIEENAFDGCTALKKVELHCTMLGKWFSGSSSVKEIVIGNEVTSIDAAAFNGCSALESVIIGNGITELNDGMFSGCSKLESITIGSKVNSISKSCFVGCDIKKCFWLTNTPPVGYETVGAEVNYVANNKYEELENVKVYSYLSSYFEADGIRYIPVSLSDRTCDIVDCVSWNGIEDFVVNDKASYKGIELTVNNIMPYSFYNNNNFDNLNLNNCGGIGDFAFANSTDMNSVALCGNITYIGSYAFENCEKITGIAVPAAVEKIGNGAFKGCALLAELIVEDRGEELLLGSNGSEPLFNDCPLDSVYIGGNITYDTSEQYGYSPFYNNKTLRTVVISNYEEEIPDNEFYGCSNLKNVTIGDGVKSIGKWAFSGCSSLDYFAFGKNLQSIGEEAFSDCTNVGKIVSKAKTPPVCDTQALDDIDKWNCTLYVPEKQIAEYQSAEQWKEFLFVEGVQAIEYTVTYIIDGKEYKTEAVEFGAEITLPVVEEKKGYTFEWIDAPATMPAEDITIEGKYTADTAIDLVELDTEEEIMFDLNGHRILDKELLTRGLYIINGKKTVIK